MEKKHSPNKCCLQAQEGLLKALAFEIKESKTLAEFSKTLEEFRLMISIMKKEPLKNERKLPLKHGVGCKTCRLKSKKPCQECQTSAKIAYKRKTIQS
jgi:hypothetical protein